MGNPYQIQNVQKCKSWNICGFPRFVFKVWSDSRKKNGQHFPFLSRNKRVGGGKTEYGTVIWGIPGPKVLTWPPGLRAYPKNTHWTGGLCPVRLSVNRSCRRGTVTPGLFGRHPVLWKNNWLNIPGFWAPLQKLRVRAVYFITPYQGIRNTRPIRGRYLVPTPMWRSCRSTPSHLREGGPAERADGNGKGQRNRRSLKKKKKHKTDRQGDVGTPLFMSLSLYSRGGGLGEALKRGKRGKRGKQGKGIYIYIYMYIYVYICVCTYVHA